MSIPFANYLSIQRQSDGTIKLDKNRLQFIQITFRQLYQGNDINDDQLRERTLKELIPTLKLTNDADTLECLNLCVSQDTVEDAELEITDRFRDKVQWPDLTIVADGRQPETKTKSKKQEHDIQQLDEISCIIHRKLDKPEVNDFIKNFLFQRLEPREDSRGVETDRVSTDGQCLLPLPKGLLIDLFIRQQMHKRGTSTFNRSREKFRLVEPISLTDEFGCWTFDHFHRIFDIWMALDLTNKRSFPTQWRLRKDARISYAILDRFASQDDDQKSSNIERPSTDSLENFIRDICKLEDNGMFKEWFDGLTANESITTYAHLTNLNLKEWERIQQLPMNALKTIKSYVDQEKQMVEARKIKDENSTDGPTYSKSELRANLHMIKLYFIRQLESEISIEEIPKLDVDCVNDAFEEMRAEGFEEDGLFNDMKSFFQPLTVTNEELKINPELLAQLSREQTIERENSKRKLEMLNNAFDEKSDRLHMLTEKKEIMSKTRRKEYEESEKQMQSPENSSYQRQTQLNKKWADENDEWKRKINRINGNILQIEKELKDTENIKTEEENYLQIIEKKLAANKTKIDKRLVKPHRGFIMYGPPGTGKSDIMGKLARKVGIAMVVEPLAAGELERPLVGQTEAIILDLCMRANRLPYLMCCISIDEIDSLAPRRDEDSSEGKVAKISVLLSVIEGTKDVANLMFFSATNRLHMMDEAFLRRMTGKFFVGRPSSDARKRILNEIPKMILQPHVIDKLASATTNFSGAAVRALNRAITVHYISQRRDSQSSELKERDALLLADRTARQYQIFLGPDTLPRLFIQNHEDSKLSGAEVNQWSKKDHLKKGHFTGKIIISLDDGCVHVESIRKFNDTYIREHRLKETEQTLQQLLERITSYGNDRNVQLLQLIDLNLLSSKGAYDEKKVFETLKERYDECMEYNRSMIIYDLDSLIGVNQSESESSMGTSVSSSVVNQSIYIYVTSRFREAKIESHQSEEMSTKERWAIAVIRDPFLLKKFTTDVGFTLTDDQQEKEEEEERRSKKIIICVKCRDLYIENENKMGTCTYHDGFIYDNLSLGLKKYKQSAAIEQLNHEEYFAFRDSKQKDELERGKARFKYICCDATLQAGGTVNGCKKAKHGFGKEAQRRNIAQVLDQETIDNWETACFENSTYNKRWTDLMQRRQNVR